MHKQIHIPDSLHFRLIVLVFDIFEEHPPIRRALCVGGIVHALCSKTGYTFSVIIFTTEYSSMARKNLPWMYNGNR